jgi:hypothetical protein
MTNAPDLVTTFRRCYDQPELMDRETTTALERITIQIGASEHSLRAEIGASHQAVASLTVTVVSLRR